MDRIDRKVDLKNLFFRCINETGSIDDFFEKVMDDEIKLEEKISYDREEEIRTVIRKEIMDELKKKIGDWIDEK